MSIPRISAQILKQLRKNSGFTQKRLAEKVGVTQGYIALIEKGSADPKLSLVNKILDCLEMINQSITAEDIMTPISKMLYSRPTDITSEVTDKMLEAGYSQVPIVNSSQMCVGTLIESDLLIKIMKEGPQLKWEEVRNVMASPLPTFPKETPVDILESILERVPAILVSGEKGKMVGIITRSDVLNQF